MVELREPYRTEVTLFQEKRWRATPTTALDFGDRPSLLLRLLFQPVLVAGGRRASQGSVGSNPLTPLTFLMMTQLGIYQFSWNIP